MVTTRKEQKPWTFLVYMAGDNNLDAEGVQDLEEMKTVGSTTGVNVIVQFDRARGHQTNRYYVRKGGKLEADIVGQLGKTDTGDPTVLTNFIRWAADNYPAQRYALVLWNHGQGWDDTDIFPGGRHPRLYRFANTRIRHSLFLTPVRPMLGPNAREPEVRAILSDDDARDFLDNLEMKQVLRDAAKLLQHPIDILGMDACLMSMVEVGYQIREGAAYTVGSEESEPGGGWPYDTILGELTKDPEMQAREFSQMIVDKYLASYPRTDVTQSACDLSKGEELATAVAGLAKELKGGLNTPEVKHALLAARAKVQTYEVSDNIDLVDFCRLLAQTAGHPQISQRCEEVIDVVQSGYVMRQGFTGERLANSHGVAVYFPTQQVSPLYAGLDFSKKTGWDEFLQAYHAAIQAR